MADISNSSLFQHIKDIHLPADVLVVLVKTEWNAAIVDELEKGCHQVFEERGVKTITLIVPGAVELPFAIQQAYANQPSVSAFIALGCVVRGGTPHFEYVCQSVTTGVTQLNLQLPVPVIFGVLTVDNNEQALERTGGIHGHKGVEAAITALKMIQLNQKLKQDKL